MMQSCNRIRAMFLRYLYLHKRSVSRTLEIIFWPVMELFVWGFLSVYLKSVSNGVLAQSVLFLIGAMIFWDILYRSQQGISLSFVEDIWTQNITNLFVSPLKIWEWIAATMLYSFLKIILIVLLLSLLALGLYHFNLISSLGFYLIPLVANLFFFGWALGLFTSGLLIRWGHAVEALIWGIPFLVQPFSAIYYPLSILPRPLRMIAECLPSTHVFEGMRQVMNRGEPPFFHLALALFLNGIYFFLCAFFFRLMYRRARETGRLGRLGMD